ncbi:MAG TPA: ribose-phosphate diphosphokinase [Nitrososphaerales archaeon]|nr:ribose-phosphate diphosphokinase [Nitrososphaerales archaeon]
MLFYTHSAEHIAKRMSMKKGEFILTKFSDGEIYSRVEENVKGKKVWVLSSTQAPGDNILELLFLLDSLQRGGAKVNLMILYFAYARQDRIVKSGEALSSKVISDLLGMFKLDTISVVHMHSTRIHHFLDFENLWPIEVFSRIIRRMELIVAPDRGAVSFARKISDDYRLPVAYMEKFRPEAERVEIRRLTGNVREKKVLIVDDMITTGHTVIKASQRLIESGATEVNVMATHGVFSGHAVRNLEESGSIKSIYVTNSIKPTFKSRMIKTLDISKFVEAKMSKVIVYQE